MEPTGVSPRTSYALMTHVHLDSTLGDRGPDADPLFTSALPAASGQAKSAAA
ncbi:hypothetical protein Save01_04852 [Streptomyces avermitilis]|nr:hypothetical protein [Streptomyces avermitilis]